MEHNHFLDPVHCYVFQESDGVTYLDSCEDAKCNGIGNEVNRTLGVEPDLGDKGVQINGSDNSYISLGTCIGDFRTDTFSLSFWFKTTETLSAFDIMGNRMEVAYGNYISLRMYGQRDESIPAGTIVGEVCEDQFGANYCIVQSSRGGFNDGNWHLVTLIREEKELRLYVDDEPVSKGSGSGVAYLVSSGKQFKIGRSLVNTAVPRFTPQATFGDFSIFDKAIDVVNNTKPLTETSNEEAVLSLEAMSGGINNPALMISDCTKAIVRAIFLGIVMVFGVIGIAKDNASTITNAIINRLSLQAVANITQRINTFQDTGVLKDRILFVWGIFKEVYDDIRYRNIYQAVRSALNLTAWIKFGIYLVVQIVALVATDGLSLVGQTVLWSGVMVEFIFAIDDAKKAC